MRPVDVFLVFGLLNARVALREKQNSKWHKIFSIKFIIIVWSSTQKYGKLPSLTARQNKAPL